MFSTTTWKQKLGLMALGSVFTIIGMLLSPITAQQDKFGDIECESLRVTGSIDCRDGFILVRDSNDQRNTFIGNGWVRFYVKSDTDYSIGETYIAAGGVTISDHDHNDLVKIGMGEHGGYVQTHGRAKGYAIMGINEKGNGAMSTYDKNGYRQ